MTKTNILYSMQVHQFSHLTEQILSELVVGPNEVLYMAKSSGPSTHPSEVYQKVKTFIVYFIINTTVEEMQHLQPGTEIKWVNILLYRSVQAQPSCSSPCRPGVFRRYL